MSSETRLREGSTVKYCDSGNRAREMGQFVLSKFTLRKWRERGDEQDVQRTGRCDMDMDMDSY